MAQHRENKTIDGAVELLKTNCFDGPAEAVTVLLNSAMVAECSDHLREASCLGLVSAILMEISDDWQTAGKRYVVFETAIEG